MGCGITILTYALRILGSILYFCIFREFFEHPPYDYTHLYSRRTYQSSGRALYYMICCRDDDYMICRSIHQEILHEWLRFRHNGDRGRLHVDFHQRPVQKDDQQCAPKQPEHPLQCQLQCQLQACHQPRQHWDWRLTTK